MSQFYGIKQMVNAIAYTIELWMHLGDWLSTQESEHLAKQKCLLDSLHHTTADHAIIRI